MAAPSREDVAVALFAKLNETSMPLVKTFSRILDSPENSPGMAQPALMLYQVGDPYEDGEKGRPSLQHLHFNAEIYTHRGSDAEKIPDTEMNQVLDQLDLALAPNPITWFQDLDGLVSYVRISGEIGRFPANDGPQSSCVVPIDVLLRSVAPYDAPWIFDSGTLWFTPGQAHDKQPQVNRTPIRVANLRGIVIEPTSDIQPVYVGKHIHPVKAILSQARIRGTVELGVFDGRLVNQILFGGQAQVGARLIVKDEQQEVPVSNQVTIVPPNGGTFDEDLGVYRGDDDTPGEDFTPMTKVDSAPGPGEYSQAGAVYTFSAGGEEHQRNMLFSYSYVANGGTTIEIPNGPGSMAPSFRLDLQAGYGDKQVNVRLNKVVTDRFSIPTTVERFSLMGMEFMAIADDSGSVGRVSVG